eukprot:gene31751-40024_t
MGDVRPPRLFSVVSWFNEEAVLGNTAHGIGSRWMCKCRVMGYTRLQSACFNISPAVVGDADVGDIVVGELVGENVMGDEVGMDVIGEIVGPDVMGESV